MEHDDGSGALRVFLLNARRIEGTELLLVALEDVTEAERARTQRAETRFRDALTGAAEGVLMVDAGGTILFANPASATRSSATSSGSSTGLSVDRLLPGPRESSAPDPGETSRVRSADQGRMTEFPIEVSLSTMTGEGAPVVVAFVTDVTERRKAEGEIREYQDRLQRMAFDAAVTEERERRRIAIELHDRIGQELALAKIKLAPRSRRAGRRAARRRRRRRWRSSSKAVERQAHAGLRAQPARALRSRAQGGARVAGRGRREAPRRPRRGHGRRRGQAARTTPRRPSSSAPCASWS